MMDERNDCEFSHEMIARRNDGYIMAVAGRTYSERTPDPSFYLVVQPTTTNGLKHPTAFGCKTWGYPPLTHFDSLTPAGRLDGTDFAKLREMFANVINDFDTLSEAPTK